MQAVTGVALLCLLSVGCTYGQEEVLLVLPDFDVFSLDFRNEELFQDRDDSEPQHNAAEEFVERLCTDYDILLGNQHVDCKKLKLVEKALKTEHSLQKREAENDVPLEGSGDGEESPELTPNEEAKAEPEPTQVDEEPVAFEAELPKEAEAPVNIKEDSQAPASVTDQSDEQQPPPEAEPAKEVENTEDVSEIKEASLPITEVPQISANETEVAPAADNQEGETPVDVPLESESAPLESEQPIVAATTETINEEQEVAVPLDVKVEEEIQLPATLPAELSPTDDELNPATTPPPLEPSEEVPISSVVPVNEMQEAVTEKAVVQEVAGTGVIKKGRKLTPEVPQTEPPKEPEKPTETGADKAQETKQTGGTEADKAKEPENLNEQQSGNAILNGVDTGTLEASDNAVKRMEPNAEIKEGSTNSEEPKSGESSKETQQARKDTKVLIVLFVAVVVVGAAAFTYNFVKKRKQKKAAEGAREENGGANALKRSLQNLNGSTDKIDPEQGTELKPLMNNSDQKPVVAEYTDEKDGIKVEDRK